jgi:hypothetical protein
MMASRKSLNSNHLFPIAFYCLICLCWTSAGEQRKEEKMETVATFAQRVGIRTDPVSEKEYGVISVPWDDIIDKINNESGGGVLKRQRPIVETASVVSKCWKMRINDSDISFTAYVSTNYHEAVVWMLHRASQTTMMTIPFIKSTPQIGNVSLITTHKNVCTYWVYRNVCMELTCTHDAMDLQHFAEKILMFRRNYSAHRDVHSGSYKLQIIQLFLNQYLAVFNRILLHALGLKVEIILRIIRI